MTTPLILAYVGMAVMLTLSCTGSAIGVTMGGNTTIAALKKKPEIFGKSMLLCVPQPVWHSVSWACGQPSSRPASYATVSTRCPTATTSSPRP